MRLAAEPSGSQQGIHMSAVTRFQTERARTPEHVAVKQRLDRFAWWLDSSIPLPGTRFRFGLDALIGLVPGLGDLAGLALSSYVLAEAARLGVSRAVLLRMGLNVALETLIGAIPIVGDIFDAVWKANQRNVRLLGSYVERPGAVRARSGLVLGGVLAVVVVALGAMLLVVFAVLRWAFTTVFQ
jgi:hypothetical protein